MNSSSVNCRRCAASTRSGALELPRRSASSFRPTSSSQEHRFFSRLFRGHHARTPCCRLARRPFLQAPEVAELGAVASSTGTPRAPVEPHVVRLARAPLASSPLTPRLGRARAGSRSSISAPRRAPWPSAARETSSLPVVRGARGRVPLAPWIASCRPPLRIVVASRARVSPRSSRRSAARVARRPRARRSAELRRSTPPRASAAACAPEATPPAAVEAPPGVGARPVRVHRDRRRRRARRPGPRERLSARERRRGSRLQADHRMNLRDVHLIGAPFGDRGEREPRRTAMADGSRASFSWTNLHRSTPPPPPSP